jgi:hypothetical protein
MIYGKRVSTKPSLPECDLNPAESEPEQKTDNVAVRLIIFLLGIISGLCIAAMAFHSKGM